MQKKKLQFIDVADTGEFAAAAFNNAKNFDHKIIELAGDELTIEEMVAKISRITKKTIKVEHVTEEEAIADGMIWPYANYQEWTNQVGYSVDINALKSFGIPLTSFTQFLEKNRNKLPL
ncbi:NmrA family NAD(P)-binding protein [Chryseobacterium sp. YIM B08800]|uniref:NmrA family NAD(P)-binding protein n=1 Tax=Chryseobacterium sp. YIM B08800 TaxID=2984136 RepID=UPI002240A1B6|nr:NmrA family NAD(P)-binding protein [Chryseobacterium sp. YIM B08800]